MPVLREAMLCNAAQPDSSGLVSLLGAFVDRVGGPQLPINVQLWFVAHVEILDEDYDKAHVVVVKVEHSDGEQLARIEGAMPTPRPAPGTFDPNMPITVNFIVQLPLSFRRAGYYWVIFTIDGEDAWDGKLNVAPQLPTM